MPLARRRRTSSCSMASGPITANSVRDVSWSQVGLHSSFASIGRPAISSSCFDFLSALRRPGTAGREVGP
jgi:hypothetical protein